MKASYVCLILLVAGLPCLAAETISNTHTFGCEGVLWDYESASWRDNTSVSWTHTLAGFTPETSSVTAATLKIDGCGIENVWWDFDGDGGYEQTDYVAVKFMGQDLGQLTGNSTTFNLSSDMIQAVTQANAEISFRNDLLTVQGRRGDYFVDLDWVDSIGLKSSTLSVTFDRIGAVGVAAVPAPGALLLAGIGTVVVGALRRRKNA